MSKTQLLALCALLITSATGLSQSQTVLFNAPFTSLSQSSVTYGQGIVADANSNLYITGTVNLLYLQRNPNGTYTPASTKIDSVGGTAYGLAIDASNNLYRPDIAPSSGNPYLAKYVYQGVNSFQKYSIGSWSSSNSPSSVAVDASYNVYVLDAGGSGATTGSIVELTPSSSCSSLSTCTTYTQTTLVTDSRLHSTTGLSIDSAGNFYVASGPNTGDTPSQISNSTAAVYKLILNSGSYTFNLLGSSWTSPAATAVDSSGVVWVTDYGSQKIYELQPASSSPSETNYTKYDFQSSTTFTCLRTLTVSKTGQLFGLESGGNGCNSQAIPEVGGTPPHNLGTPSVGGTATQEIDLTFSTPQPTVSYRVLNQGTTSSSGFVDATPGSGATAGGTPYCTQGTGSGSGCAVVAGFSPAGPGLQEGALQVLDSNGNVTGTNYFYGVGYGSQATVAPGQVTTSATSQLASPGSLIIDPSGNTYIADPASNLIRLLASGGSISTLAGTGGASSSSDPACGAGGQGSTTNLTPSGIALDGAGTLYIADPNQNRVCAMNTTTGVLSLVAGTGSTCSSATAACGDGGAAASAQLALGTASGVAVDGLGNLLIADSGDNRIRSVNLGTGVITTVAGAGVACNTTAACGDGGLATAAGAYLNAPTAIAVNASGDYLIADTGDNRIRKVSELTSAISTVAGTGTNGFAGDGASATSAELSAPGGIAADAAGDLYISDTGNNRVRVVMNGTGFISTLVGGGLQGPASNPVSAVNAALNGPTAVALDQSGNLYIADAGDSLVESVSAVAAALNFPTSTVAGTVDGSDGAQTVSLVNIGNSSLTYVSPGLTVPIDFERLSGNSGDCSATFSLASGTSCSARIEFYPQSAGQQTESFVFSDNALNGNPSTQVVSLTGTATSPAPTISISPGTLAAATVGVAYSQGLSASGGTSPYTYAVTSGSLPAGLSLSSSGVLSGTPSTAGQSFGFTVTATDSSSSGGPFTGQASYSMTVSQGTATVTLGGLAQTYTGSGLPATATTSPTGLTVNFTYNGSTTAPTAPGSYTVLGTINDTNYQGTATGTLVISKATASVTLGGLAQTYTGSPLAATATTSPTGLAVDFTYNGSSTVPTAAGSYTIVATIDDANYQGTATGTLAISKATAAVTLGGLAQTYTGSPLAAAATTSPTGLAVNFTYNGSTTTPTAAGSYTVVATINDANYQGAATGTLVISKATASVTLGGLAQTYTGSALPAAATTSPTGLAVNFTYNGSTTAPSAAGSYTVVAMINDANYQGTATGTLVISKATASVTLGGLAQTYTGSALPATATTSPSGLAVNFTYNGSSAVPTATGSYTVVATIDDGNYQGTATGTLVISKSQPTLAWATPAAITYGTPLGAAQLNASVNGIPGSFVYSPAAGTVLGAGSNQKLSVTFNPSDPSSYLSATASVQVSVNQGAPTLNLASSSNPSVAQNSVTLTATMTYPSGLPTGTVTFLDGTAPLGTGTLSGGVATLATSTLSAGSHSISAIYNGDANFTRATSAVISQSVLDFGVGLGTTQAGTSQGSGTQQGTSQDPLQMVPGGTAGTSIAIAPSTGVTLPMLSVLTVTGLPPGATATLQTPGWTQLTSTSWSLPANTTLQNVTLSFHAAAVTASLKNHAPLGGTVISVTLCCLVLPFGRSWRKGGKRIRGAFSLLFLMVATLLGTSALTGCGSSNGFFGQPETTYNVVVTVTTGALSHSTTLVLNVE